MISIELARKLRQSGLLWRPAEGDRFVVPDRGLDDKIYTISELIALIQLYNGNLVAAFHGVPEWALDYVLLSEVLWMPTESQLREEIARRSGPEAPLSLERTATGYRCRTVFSREQLVFEADGAEAAYALALSYILAHSTDDERLN